jgi:uncharacterized iron-regulated protein
MHALRSLVGPAVAVLFLTLSTACGSAAAVVVERPPFAVDSTVRGPSSWPELAEDLRDADIVYFGESHDDRDQHALEHLVFSEMERHDGPLLLGLEMFQTPFQDALDAYVRGDIDEREMLRRTEYFDRWRYDYTFYAPLWRLCRARGHRVVALNAPAAVSRKVGRTGVASLDAEERSAIAADVQLGVPAYEERVRAIMNGVHPMPEPQLTYMVEAQTVWDETMAESAARALTEAGPGARMFVVAGRFHVQGRNGIPDRVARRVPGLRSLIVIGRSVGASDDEPDWTPEACDYVAIVSHETPRLGVDIEENLPADDGAPYWTGLRIKSVAPGGAADLAGLEAGDVITAVDREAVADRVDLRHALDRCRIVDALSVWAGRDSKIYSFVVHLRPLPAAQAPARPLSEQPAVKP